MITEQLQCVTITRQQIYSLFYVEYSDSLSTLQNSLRKNLASKDTTGPNTSVVCIVFQNCIAQLSLSSSSSSRSSSSSSNSVAIKR